MHVYPYDISTVQCVVPIYVCYKLASIVTAFMGYTRNKNLNNTDK